MIFKECPICLRSFRTFPSFLKKGQSKTCSLDCNAISKRKAKLIGYYDSKPIYIGGNGYPFILRSLTKDKILPELLHRVIAEKALGKALPKKCVVHHVDGNKLNWTSSNLIVLQSDKEHKELHARMRVIKAGGNPKTEKICCKCKKLQSIENFRKSPKNYMGKYPRCITCCKEYEESYRRKKRGI